ncbi:MAG: DUF6250 domain-containing protein [Sphingomonas taxi]
MLRRAMTVMAALPLVAQSGDARSLSDWTIEAASPAARVTMRNGMIDIDTPKGLTLWWRKPVAGRVTITFEAMAVANGGTNDTVSDLNAFWMATNADGGSVLARPRSGAFAAYDDLNTYYVGIGGNRNTTTRFRRYIGQPGNRPLLPEHDLSAPADLLTPNVWTRIRLIADGRTIAVERDGRRLFALDDAQPYTRGHWGLRTTWSHLRIRHVRVTQR